MFGPALTTIKARLTLLSNDAINYEGTITSCPGVTNHLLRRYATNAVIVKADEEICNFEQGLLTPQDFSQMFLGLTIRSGDLYNK